MGVCFRDCRDCKSLRDLVQLYEFSLILSTGREQEQEKNSVGLIQD